MTWFWNRFCPETVFRHRGVIVILASGGVSGPVQNPWIWGPGDPGSMVPGTLDPWIPLIYKGGWAPGAQGGYLFLGVPGPKIGKKCLYANHPWPGPVPGGVPGGVPGPLKMTHFWEPRALGALEIPADLGQFSVKKASGDPSKRGPKYPILGPFLDPFLEGSGRALTGPGRACQA